MLVHVWAAGEDVYDGKVPEHGYHEIPSSGEALASLASAAGGTAFGEHAIGGAIAAEKTDLGSGPTSPRGGLSGRGPSRPTSCS